MRFRRAIYFRRRGVTERLMRSVIIVITKPLAHALTQFQAMLAATQGDGVREGYEYVETSYQDGKRHAKHLYSVKS